MDSTERRNQDRSDAFCAVELSSSTKPQRCGVTRNASERGLLIVTPSRFQEGDDIEVSVHLREESARRRGRVVRVAVNSLASNELWRYRMAVELEEPLPARLLEGAVEAARARKSA